MHALFVHGVGTQSSGYSTYAQKHLAAGLAGRRTLYGQEVVWSHVLDKHEKKMLREVGKRGSSNRPLQRAVIEILADALCWQHSREPIFDQLDRAYCRLRAPGPVVLCAHSLGVPITAEWVRTRRVAVEHFVTFGTNLQLFNLGREGEFVVPERLAAARWTNFFSDTDFLGWPLRGWLPQVRDVEVNVGGLLTRWWGASHLGFFNDRKFWAKTVPSYLG